MESTPDEHDRLVQTLCDDLATLAKTRSTELGITVTTLSILVDARRRGGEIDTFSISSLGYDTTEQMVETTMAHLVAIAVELGLPGARLDPLPGTPGFQI